MRITISLERLFSNLSKILQNKQKQNLHFILYESYFISCIIKPKCLVYKATVQILVYNLFRINENIYKTTQIRLMI